MRLDEYVEGKPRGEIARLARDSGLAYATVWNLCHGDRLKTYDAAKRLSDATEGAVSVADLCEPAAPGDAA